MIPITDITCTACGCLCDDIAFEPDGSTKNACQHGQQWFDFVRDNSPPAPALLSGRDVSLDEGIAAAADLLATARFPLIFGAGDLCVDGQRALVRLADCIGACVDTGGSAEDATTYFSGIGASACTWGEVIQRADFVVYWQCDLANDWWRHGERIRQRLQRCQETVHIGPEGTIEAIWLLRAMVQGKKCDLELPKTISSPSPPGFAGGEGWGEGGERHSPPHPSTLPRKAGGEGARDWRALAAKLCDAEYAIIVHHANSRVEVALQGLARDVNLQTRCRVIDLGGRANSAGWSQVIRWQTGYSRAVGLHRGYPRSSGREFAAETLLTRGEVDAVVSVGASYQLLSTAAQRQLRKLPHIVIAPDLRVSTASSPITLFVQTPGIHGSGTLFRADGLTLPLRQVVSSSFPRADVLINRLTDELRSRQTAGTEALCSPAT